MTPNNKQLYDSIKEQVKSSVNRWPSAYASAMLIKQYKQAGGTFANDNKPKRLKRWFEEDWKDIKTLKPCGNVKSSEYYPTCRPTIRINSKTPVIMSELSETEKKQKVKQKQKIKTGILPKFSKKN
jgi:Family of unknown function (DUF5872)